MKTAYTLLLISAVAFLLPSCKVIEAPETIEELVVWGFEHYNDKSDYLEAMGENLFPLVDEEMEGLDEGFHVDSLERTQLEAAGIDDPEVENILGALGAVEYTHGMRDVMCAVNYPFKTEIFESFKEYDVLEEDDLECFLDGDCERYNLTYDQVVNVALLGDATQHVFRTYRWVDQPDADPYIVSRGLSPTPTEFNTDIMAVDQQYDLNIFVPNGSGVRRIDTIWVEARFLGLEVPEYFAVEKAVQTMKDNAESIDAWLDDGGGC